jgi:hypothetical protein
MATEIAMSAPNRSPNVSFGSSTANTGDAPLSAGNGIRNCHAERKEWQPCPQILQHKRSIITDRTNQ